MSDGAMLDLMARRKKDSFFIQNAQRSWFGTPYERRGAATREVRYEYPASPAQFGKWVDIELPRNSDILLSAGIRIALPTWLPPEVAAVNLTKKVEVEGVPGTFLRYGWTNSIANVIIDRWALFMDNYMLHEGYGEYNIWNPDSTTIQFHAPIIHAATGMHDDSPTAIQHAATLPELVFRIPMVGCQGEGYQTGVGFPICAIKSQRLYLRLWLAEKSALVQSSLIREEQREGKFFPVYETCPNPWGGKRIKIDDVLTDYVTLQEYELAQPYIYIRYQMLNLNGETRAEMIDRPHALLFKQQLRQQFNIQNADWRGQGQFKVRLEINGLFQRLILGIASNVRLKQNRYLDFVPAGGGPWLDGLSLIVNAQDRIYPWETEVFTELAKNLHLLRDINTGFYFVTFGVSPDLEPAGAFNLSQTQKATLILNLADIPYDPVDEHDRLAVGTVYAETWNILDIVDGKAIPRFTI